uniref:Uncharacterized protein n=1 Tax=Leersia perrieri TaxID=77586 RepID=A0A0D9WTB0_9ORYZ
MYAPSVVTATTPPAIAGAAVAPFRSFDAGVVEFAPSAPDGDGGLPEAGGGCDTAPPPPGVVDGDGATAAGGDSGVVVGAGPGDKAAGDGTIGETDGPGDVAGDGTIGEIDGVGDDVAGDGDGAKLGGATGEGIGGDGGVWWRSAMTTTMSFSPARQLDSLPLMKKKGPDRSNVNTVLPSSNLPPPATAAVVLHASYAA